MNEVKGEYKKGFLHKGKPYKMEVKVYEKPVKRNDVGEYHVLGTIYNELNVKKDEYVLADPISAEEAEEFMTNTINYFNK